MKREHQEANNYGTNNNISNNSSSISGKGECSTMASSGKAKLWEEGQQDAGMDELLAVLGYKVRSSDMADVALKLEQLEMVLDTAQEDGLSHLSCDTVHYNPSDLSGWVQSMLSELNVDPVVLPGQQIQDHHSQHHHHHHHQHHHHHPVHAPPPPPLSASNHYSSSNPYRCQEQIDHSSKIVYNDDSEYDLRAIPGVAALSRPVTEADTSVRKRIKTSNDSGSVSNSAAAPPPPLLTTSSTTTSSSSCSEATRPVVLMDSQETGVRLVHTLMACAEAVQQENLKLADALVKHIGLLAASQAGAMRKVATYFAEALARRIYKIYPQECLDSSYTDILQLHFYETCPYLKFAHFTANQAILEAFATANRVHVVDFGLKQGMQWPALMQALALRPGGPPAFRLTGIGPPQPDNTDALQEVGWKLAQLAETIGVKFEFKGFVANSLADLDPSILGLRPPEEEAVAVNSVFELHRLLARPDGIDKVLSSIKAMSPKIVTIVEQEANHNGPVFLDRFTEALHYYSSLFDSLEGSGISSPVAPPSPDLVMSELYLGRQICNVVACEGPDRVERHETLAQWRTRFESAGFDPVHLGSNAYKQASMLLALFAGGDGYRVEENDGCLMLGWHTRPLIATSAWQLAAADSQPL